MNKTSIAPVVAFAFLIVFASVAIAQMAKKRWEKTVTLPSGEVILDISGEWDLLYEKYGPFSGDISDILTITQPLSSRSEAGGYPKVQKRLKANWTRMDSKRFMHI